MKINHKPAYASQVSVIRLETDTERALSEEQLLRIVANVQGIEYNHRTGSYELTGGDLGMAPPFGGMVSRFGDYCEVSVNVPIAQGINGRGIAARGPTGALRISAV